MSTELSPRSISFKSVQVFAVIGAGAILQFAFYVLLARLLGIESYGIYAFGFSVYTLSLLIVKLSGDTLILRELSVHTDDSNAAGVVQFIVSIVTLLYVLLACLYALFGLGWADRRNLSWCPGGIPCHHAAGCLDEICDISGGGSGVLCFVLRLAISWSGL